MPEDTNTRRSIDKTIKKGIRFSEIVGGISAALLAIAVQLLWTLNGNTIELNAKLINHLVDYNEFKSSVPLPQMLYQDQFKFQMKTKDQLAILDKKIALVDEQRMADYERSSIYFRMVENLVEHETSKSSAQ